MEPPVVVRNSEVQAGAALQPHWPHLLAEVVFMAGQAVALGLVVITEIQRDRRASVDCPELIPQAAALAK